MNLYIGTSIEDIDINDYNVELDDDFIEFIHSSQNELNVNMDAWYSIDPYDDVIIKNSDLTDLLKMFGAVLNCDTLNKCDNSVRLSDNLMQLIELIKKAVRTNKNLISIGD